MTADRIRYVAVATTILQVALGARAVWSLWDTKVSSEQFVRVHGGEHFRYKPEALLIPAALMVLFGSAMVSALLCSRLQHARRLFTVFVGLALAVVAGWWVVLSQSNYHYYKFFVASGTLPPNEIMSSEWPLAVVMLLLSLAALLGLIPLVWLALGTRRANS